MLDYSYENQFLCHSITNGKWTEEKSDFEESGNTVSRFWRDD